MLFIAVCSISALSYTAEAAIHLSRKLCKVLSQDTSVQEETTLASRWNSAECSPDWDLVLEVRRLCKRVIQTIQEMELTHHRAVVLRDSLEKTLTIFETPPRQAREEERRMEEDHEKKWIQTTLQDETRPRPNAQKQHIHITIIIITT